MVEHELKKLSRSFKNRHFVSFFEPEMLEVVAHIHGLKYDEIIKKRETLIKRKKKLAIFIEELSRRQRQCITCYYGLMTNESETQQKIAQRFKIKQGTVARTLTRARANLKRMFGVK